MKIVSVAPKFCYNIYGIGYFNGVYSNFPGKEFVYFFCFVQCLLLTGWYYARAATGSQPRPAKIGTLK